MITSGNVVISVDVICVCICNIIYYVAVSQGYPRIPLEVPHYWHHEYEFDAFNLEITIGTAYFISHYHQYIHRHVVCLSTGITINYHHVSNTEYIYIQGTM